MICHYDCSMNTFFSRHFPHKTIFNIIQVCNQLSIIRKTFNYNYSFLSYEYRVCVFE